MPLLTEYESIGTLKKKRKKLFSLQYYPVQKTNIHCHRNESRSVLLLNGILFADFALYYCKFYGFKMAPQVPVLH